MIARNHPLRQVLEDAAHTGQPRTTRQVNDAVERYADGLDYELGPVARRKLRDALLDAGRRVAQLRAEGNNGAARSTATELAAGIAGDDTWTKTPEQTITTTDPAELARSIPRF